MVAQSIEYLELYAYDDQAVEDYFVRSLGFTQVAESAGPEKNSVLLRQGAVQLILSTGPSTRDFLDAHGDGVADIAFSCDDVTQVRDAAIAAGATVTGSAQGNPVVSGFGAVCHTLLPAGPDAGYRFPPGRTWTTGPEPSAGPGPAAGTSGRIRLLDHVAVCLAGGTLAAYADFYAAGFGLARYSSEYVNIGSQAMDSIVVRSSSGSITFTLIAPDLVKQAGQIDAFLERNGGPGVQHLAYLVAEIVPAVRDFGDQGVEFLRTPASYYEMLAERFPDMRQELAGLRSANVLADRDEWGYLLQLFTRSPHERNTLFYELIQRRGARGFGTSNIRALYEAVERDRLRAE